MASNYGYIEIANGGAPRFTNASDADLLIYTDSNTQSICLGVNQGSNAAIKITNSNMSIEGDIQITRGFVSQGIKVIKNVSGVATPNNVTALVSAMAGVSTYDTSNYRFTLSNSQTDFRFLGANYSNVGSITSTGQYLAPASDTSNSPAFSWSEDSNTGIYHASNGQVGVSCQGALSTTFAANTMTVGTLSSPGYVCAGNLGMFRNRIINGDMRVDQRNSGAGVGGQTGSYLTYKVQPSSFYTVDRFAVAAPNIGTLTAKQVTLPTADVEATGGNFKNAVALGLVPTDSLGLYLPMEGNLTDASGNNLSVTTTGTMQYVNAVVIGSNALYLANDANIPGNQASTNQVRSTYTFPNQFSVSFWMMPTTVSATYNCVAFATNTGSAGLNNALFIVRSTDGKLYCGFWGSASATWQGGVSVAANQWVHACLTYNNGTLSFYTNGALNGSTTGTLAQSGFMLGNGATAITGNAFAGFIDDFRIYNRVLTAGEVSALATNVGIPTPPSNTSFATRLTFDGTFADAQGGLSNVTVTGTAVYSPVCKTGTQSLDLTANTANGTATNCITYTTGSYSLPLTVSAWFNATSVASIQDVVTIGNNGSTNTLSVLLNVDSTGKFGFGVYVGSWITVYSSFTMSPGTWYHVALTANASSYLNCYVNGVLVASYLLPSGTLGVNTGGTPNQLRVGAITGTTASMAFKGFIDDVRVYNRVLSSQEVAGLYASSQYAAYSLYQQTIEGLNISDLGWGTSAAQPITASMWIKNNSPSAQQFSIATTNAGANLIAWMPFDNSVSDVLGLFNNSSNLGSPALSSSTFKVGTSALDLSANTAGAGAAVAVRYNVQPALIAAPITLSAWIYPITTNVNYSIIASFGTPGTAWSFQIAINSSSQLYAIANFSGTTYTAGQSAASVVTANTWTHVSATYVAGSCITLYVNGRSVATSATIPSNAVLLTTIANTPTMELWMGRDNQVNGNAYKGYIDDMRVYNCALSADQIAQLYTNNATSTTTSTYLTPRSAVYVTPSIPANSWQRVQFTIPGDTSASNWLTTSDAGLTLSVCLGASALYNTTNVAASSGNTSAIWNSAPDFMGSSAQLYTGSATNLLASVANSVYITGVQVEKGTMATPFEYRPYSIELPLCQRYCKLIGAGIVGRWASTTIFEFATMLVPALRSNNIGYVIVAPTNVYISTNGSTWNSYGTNLTAIAFGPSATPSTNGVVMSITFGSATATIQGYTGCVVTDFALLTSEF